MRKNSCKKPSTANGAAFMDEDEIGETGEFELPRLSREDVIQLARKNAIRGLVIKDKNISYVAYSSDMEDFRHVEFLLDERHGWLQTGRMLLSGERLPEEQITDDHIIKTAMSGKMVTAIRLYRAKYEVGLKDGEDGVERLVWGAE
jgi:hypothetical protein